MLLLAVLTVVIIDLVRDTSKASSSTASNTDIVPDRPDDGTDVTIKTNEKKDNKKDPLGWKFNLKDSSPKLGLNFNDDMRFGLEMIGVEDPRPEKKGDLKKLTYWKTGDSNNTIIKIGSSEHYFGRKTASNTWGEKSARRQIPLPGNRIGYISEMTFRIEKVVVAQHVEIVPGESGLLDTCLIWYKVKNLSGSPQRVGIRVLLDTYIGANDGVPFTIPGERGFLTTMKEFPQKIIPDYIEVVENPNDINSLGTIVRMQLKGIKLPGVDNLEEIQAMRICRWPVDIGVSVRWEWEMEPMDKVPDAKDSCVALYWAYREMNPGEERQMAFTYGLSKLEISGSDDKPEAPPDKNETAMAMSEPGSVLMNSEFIVTAYLWRTKPGQNASIVLPAGLSLADGEKEEKPVQDPGDKRTQVSWKVKAGKPGTYKVQATSEKSKTKPREVQVRDPSTSIFG